ncbi:MAG: A/G-specific adenine glycosylase [Chthoniobacterales bacterium]
MPRRAEPSELLSDPRSFRQRLHRWFRREGRDLPWRRTRDPYAILVSEFMLQQTQVAAVIPYYERWLERFPDFATLARAQEAEVLHAWQGLGYYARARNLHAAGKHMVEKFGGELPADVAEIAQLPGVGRYTAGAIASFAFDLPAPIVDANIARVLARLTNYQEPINCAAGQSHLWTTAAALTPPRGARVYNSAVMELGALVCLPRQPRCGECPVRAHCRAENPALLPIKKARRKTVFLTERHAFHIRRDQILLEQSRVRWRGMWILPRLSAAPPRAPLFQLDFPFTHHRVTLAVFDRMGRSRPNENQKWFPLAALTELPVPTPHRRALGELLPAACLTKC